MELEKIMAHFMTIIAITPFIAVGISKITETKRYKNLYGKVKG